MTSRSLSRKRPPFQTAKMPKCRKVSRRKPWCKYTKKKYNHTNFSNVQIDVRNSQKIQEISNHPTMNKHNKNMQKSHTIQTRVAIFTQERKRGKNTR